MAENQVGNAFEVTHDVWLPGTTHPQFLAKESNNLHTHTSKAAAFDSNTVFPLDGRDIFQVSEEELVAVAETAPALHSLCGARVARISQNLVIKKSTMTLPSEAEAMKLVAEKTSVRLPRVFRSFTVYGTGGIYNSTGYIVMDYIPGTCLSKCLLDKLSPEEHEDVVCQVVDMIQELQALHTPLVGPVGGGPSLGKWFSVYGSGPFTGGVSDFEDYCNRRLGIAKRTRHSPATTPPFKFSKFVMTHQDIAARNLILDHDGQVHLIDWGCAGAYPPIFEVAALARESSYDGDGGLSCAVLQRLEYNEQDFQQLMGIHGVMHFLDQTDLEKLEQWMNSRHTTTTTT